jgi:hypothetical protein
LCRDAISATCGDTAPSSPLQFVLDSGRFDQDTLLELADHREANPLDRQIFAGQLRAGARLPDAGFRRYGATAEQITRIRSTANTWAATLTDRLVDGSSGTMPS